MATRYITAKTSRLYDHATGGARKMILIFGDEVETTGPAVSGRVPATYRGRPGFIDEDHLGNDAALEMYFIDVGQGDSTFVVTPGRKKILIDGGQNRRALGFLRWKYRLDDAANSVDIDLLVLSHADGDHLNGVVPILEHPRIHVQRIIHSGVATYKAGSFGTTLGDLDASGDFLTTLHDAVTELDPTKLSEDFAGWRTAVVAEGCPYEAVDSTHAALDLGDPDVTLEILGPRRSQAGGAPALAWLGDKSHTINGHSVLLKLTHGSVSAFFSGDLNIEGAKHVLADPGIAAGLDAHVFKAPHHGSHEYHPPLLEAVRPQISVISSGDGPDHGHPRAVFVGAVGLASRSQAPLVFSTEIAATFVDADDPPPPAHDDEATDAGGRRLFKRRLHGMINVRTDGQHLYAARRVAAGYWWESYGPLDAAPKPTVLGDG
jgi:hypothetical protein